MNPRVLIENLRADPSRLHSLSWSDFESVVAELLASFGWQVSPTPLTRDGGYDILGVVNDSSGLQTSWIVECKHFRVGHKVGIETVRQLFGVKQHLGVPNAVLVTTSEFTEGARLFCRSRNDIQLVDVSVLSGWVEKYRSPPIGDTYTESRSFASCFVSYSSKDEEFTQRLVSALKARGIRTWFAPEDMRPGDKIADQVRSAIRQFDRLIVVISDNSMKSNWVGSEIAMALGKEMELKRRVMFPVSLVTFDKIKEWSLFDVDTGLDIGKQIRSYHISNFSNWRQESAFESEVDKIADALMKASPEFAEGSRIKLLIQDLRRGETPDKRRAAALAISQLGRSASAAVPTLTKALKDSSMYVRNAAAFALGEIDTDEARAALTDFERRANPSQEREPASGSVSLSVAAVEKTSAYLQQLDELFKHVSELHDTKLFSANRTNRSEEYMEPKNEGSFISEYASELENRHGAITIEQLNKALGSFLANDRKRGRKRRK